MVCMRGYIGAPRVVQQVAMAGGTEWRRGSDGHRHMLMRHKMSSAAQPVLQTPPTAVQERIVCMYAREKVVVR